MSGHQASFRPTRATLDLGALAQNLRETRRLAGARAICAVVKANAYGHGAPGVALRLQTLGVEVFGVALVEEALALRQGGIVRPILVWGGAIDGAGAAMLEHGLTPVVGRPEQVEEMAAAARAAGTVMAVHLDVDTGMARLGSGADTLPQLLAALQAQSACLRVVGLMSHLAVADIRDDPFNALQTQRFAQAMALVQAAGLHPEQVHLANSPATVALQDGPTPTTLVRCGLLLYGMQPMRGSYTPNLLPVMRLRSAIVALRRLPPRTPVSYGGRFLTAAGHDSLIATLPIGYADGYRRDFSGRAQVLVHGQRVPVVGTVCMDTCMIDVTKLKDVAVGDEAVLMGEQRGERITAEELAGWANTISYEIVCGIGARVPRLSDEGESLSGHGG